MIEKRRRNTWGGGEKGEKEGQDKEEEEKAETNKRAEANH